MIRVTIEMVPSGREEEKYQLGEVFIVNDETGTAEYGNYVISCKDYMSRDVSFPVRWFPRGAGFWVLLKEVFKECVYAYARR